MITTMQSPTRRANAFVLAGSAVLLGFGPPVPAATASNCYAACDSNYYLCNRGGASPGERSCATSRSTCYMGCTQTRESFGAIAYSDATTAHGHAYEYDTRAEAEERAMRECATKRPDARDCKVLVWFNRGCGALVVGEKGAYGAAQDEKQEAATQKAMAHCRPFGSATCTIAREICSPR